ncbi:MAG: YkvA family protein [Planctomycetota bacterium]|jgi:uncharacterized membrane protein YkvA (DUF1232 family)
MRTETRALCIASRDPRTPWLAKILTMGIVAYALSPVDLIPDFIPVLGQLDDLVLVPLGLFLALKLVPREVLDASRRRASEDLEGPDRRGRLVGIFPAALWLTIFALSVTLVLVI